MTTIKKILCAIDLTKASRNAFDRALSVARVSKARLYILHAVPATKPFSWRARERLDLLTRLRQRAEREGVPVRVVEQHGDPAGIIVLHANSRKADLVVLGSNRRRGWQRFRGVCRGTSAPPCGLGSVDRSVGRFFGRASRGHCESIVQTLAKCGRTTRGHWFSAENTRSLRQLERDAEVELLFCRRTCLRH